MSAAEHQVCDFCPPPRAAPHATENPLLTAQAIKDKYQAQVEQSKKEVEQWKAAHAKELTRLKALKEDMKITLADTLKDVQTSVGSSDVHTRLKEMLTRRRHEKFNSSRPPLLVCEAAQEGGVGSLRVRA